jgi:hypothetical protein
MRSECPLRGNALRGICLCAGELSNGNLQPSSLVNHCHLEMKAAVRKMQNVKMQNEFAAVVILLLWVKE